MDDELLATLRADLLRDRDELKATLAEKPGDDALREMLASGLRDLEHALAKLDKGSYGRCEVCRTALPALRLQMLPTTRLCLKCENERS